jgi:hypothetical protein
MSDRQRVTSDSLVRVLERHYSVGEVAKAWGLSADKVQRMFRDMEGVFKIGKKHQTLRIPESILTRFYDERSRGFSLEVQRRNRAI